MFEEAKDKFFQQLDKIPDREIIQRIANIYCKRIVESEYIDAYSIAGQKSYDRAGGPTVGQYYSMIGEAYHGLKMGGQWVALKALCAELDRRFGKGQSDLLIQYLDQIRWS